MDVLSGRRYEIAFSTHPAGMRAHVIGSGADLGSTLAYWMDIAAAARDRRPTGLLLIDEFDGEPLGPQDWQRLVDCIGDVGLTGVRIAHVKPHGLQKIEYCEIYAREAGIDAHVFANEQEADLWLRYGAT